MFTQTIRASRQFLVCALLVASFVLSASGQNQTIFTDVHHDVSLPLRDLAIPAPGLTVAETDSEPVRRIPIPTGVKPSNVADPVLQTPAIAATALQAPVAGLNFEGLGAGLPGFVVAAVPPDTNGAVGLTQYVQWVNTSFAVFDKTTGNIALGPVAGNSLWQGFGGNCETNNDGDPVVLYDKAADRWIFTQFSVRTTPPPGLGPFLQCVAVSTTSDATGTYNRYSFEYSAFDDYPKMGVWPDAYYVTFNIFTPPSFAFSGAEACAYDRNAMLAGLPATQICFQQPNTVGGLLPSDLDGHNPPPAGSPNYMVYFGANVLNLFKFHADFVTPANSTFTGPTVIPVAPFTPLCDGATCVPQPGVATQLDSLADRLMYRLAYRNFGDHESLVVNHSVAVGTPTPTGGGVRWYEIQNPSGTPVVAQQSTFAPDTTSFRWMGSIAMDQAGDIALGYSVSSASISPSIALTARAASDIPSTMQPETTIISGSGSQTVDSLNQPLTRWGDYSAMQVDPVDDCTFWYTTEYLSTTGIFNWHTRIANFKFAGCTSSDLTVSAKHAGNFTQSQTGATYTLTASNTGGLPTTGTVTVVDTLPSGLTATAIAGTGWSCDLPTVTCTRSDVLASQGSYPAMTLTVNVATNAAGQLTNSVSVSGGGETNLLNNTATDLTTIIQQGPDPTIAVTHSGAFVQGQTGIYSITATNVGLSPLDGTLVTVTDVLPAGLTANAVSGTGWNCVVGPPVKCTRTDVLAANASYPTIALTVNVATGAPASALNTVQVSGGGETNTLNDSASDTTIILPPPPDLTISKTHTGNFQQGQNFAAYTITVSNAGTTATSGTVTVTDNFPVGLTAGSMSGLGWFCSSTTCTRGDALAPASSYPVITVNVNVAGNAPASVTNTAVVSGGGETNTTNDTATDVTTITPTPDLAITKTHVGDFTVGQPGTYTITVSNAGGAPTVGTVTMTDFLPSGMTATSITATGWTCSQLPTSFVNCTRSDALATNASYPVIAITVRVDGAFASPEINNATVNGGGELNLANDNASDSTVVKAPSLAITKTHSPATFSVGQTGTYTITVSNTGTTATSTATPVTVTDFLPQGLTATDLSASTGWTCSPVPTTFVTCTRSDSLASTLTFPAIVMVVRIDGTQAPTVVNQASVSGGGDLTQHFASDSAPVSGPLLSIAKTHSPATFIVGQNGTYTITVGNTGVTATASGAGVAPVTVTDFLPQGITATDLSASTGWTCSAVPTTFITCTRSDVLATGNSYPAVLMTVRVDGAFSGTIINNATVTGGGDLAQHNASDSAPVTAPVLGITKTHVGNFTVGQTGDYTVTVSNTGTVATVGTVQVNDFLPFGMTASVITATGWSCSPLPTQFVNCTRSDALAAAASFPAITLTVSVDSTAPASVTNQASVTGGGDLSTHSASDPTTINVPDLAIAETHTGNFFAGETGALYTVTVSNVGAFATAGGTVNFSDFLPPGVIASGAAGVGWTCPSFFPAQFVNCSRPAGVLTPGSAYPALLVTVNVASDAPATVINNSSVGGIGDANFANNAIADSTTISRVAVLPNSNANVSVTAGTSATFAFNATLATAPSVGTITFTATGLPPNAKAVFSPATITQSGGVALTVDTSGNGHIAALSPMQYPTLRSPYLTLLLPLAGVIAICITLRKNKRTALRWGLAVSAICLFIAFSGCGGGGGTGQPGPNPTPVPTATPTPIPTPTPPPVTPAGAYTITVTATSSVAGTPSASTQIVLTVK